MFAICVTFTIRPGKISQFLPMMLTNAAASLTKEKGCSRFDVCTDADRPDEVFLYEIYDSPAAFEHHKTTAHFHAFDAAATALIADKRVASYRTIANADGGPE